MDVATFVSAVFNNELPFRVEAYDGSVALPSVDIGRQRPDVEDPST